MYLDQKAFGKRLQEARKAKKWTQEELSQRVRVGRQHISKIERGEITCSLDVLLDLSEELEVSTDYLLKGHRLLDKKEVVEELKKLTKQMVIITESIQD